MVLFVIRKLSLATFFHIVKLFEHKDCNERTEITLIYSLLLLFIFCHDHNFFFHYPFLRSGFILIHFLGFS